MASTMLFSDLEPYYVTFKQHMKLKIITCSCQSENTTLHKWSNIFHVICHFCLVLGAEFISGIKVVIFVVI